MKYVVKSNTDQIPNMPFLPFSEKKINAFWVFL